MTVRVRDLKREDFAKNGTYYPTEVVKTWRRKGKLWHLCQVTEGPEKGKYLLRRFPILEPAESFTRVAQPSDLPTGAKGDTISHSPATKLAAARFLSIPKGAKDTLHTPTADAPVIALFMEGLNSMPPSDLILMSDGDMPVQLKSRISSAVSKGYVEWNPNKGRYEYIE